MLLERTSGVRSDVLGARGEGGAAVVACQRRVGGRVIELTRKGERSKSEWRPAS